MDDAIKKAGADGFTHAFTNLLCCVPLNPENSCKVRTPTAEEILACRQRLREFINVANPKLIIAVGNEAQRALAEMQAEGPFAVPIAGMPHPATVLYALPYNNAYKFRRLVDAIAGAVADHFTGTS
jgi:uracil-DNA glycosylase family 4